MDDTKLHPSLRPYEDGCGSWRIAGVHGGTPDFLSYNELSEKISEYQDKKADKVSFIQDKRPSYLIASIANRSESG